MIDRNWLRLRQTSKKTRLFAFSKRPRFFLAFLVSPKFTSQKWFVKMAVASFLFWKKGTEKTSHREFLTTRSPFPAIRFEGYGGSKVLHETKPQPISINHFCEVKTSETRKARKKRGRLLNANNRVFFDVWRSRSQFHKPFCEVNLSETRRTRGSRVSLLP